MKYLDERRTDLPIYLFKKGELFEAYTFFGSHKVSKNKWVFTVWVPRAAAVSLVGDFNGWQAGQNPMHNIKDSGIWQTVVTADMQFQSYKYAITDKNGKTVNKSDPYAFHFETRPGNASKAYRAPAHRWKDKKWQTQDKEPIYNCPMNIYEVHLSGFMQPPGRQRLYIP